MKTLTDYWLETELRDVREIISALMKNNA